MILLPRSVSKVCLVVLAAAGLCSATSFTGTFETDTDIFFATFVVPGQAQIFVTSFGYGGGINGDLTVIDPGGFAPDLALYDPNGNLVVQDTTGGTAIGAGCSNGTNQDPTTHLCLDATLFFPTSIAGTYTVVITEQNVGNDPPPTFSGPGSYPQAPGTDVTTPPFQDLLGNQRNGNFAFDFTEVSVPEPTTVVLTLLGIGALALRKRRSASKPVTF
jgi:hypothetical protein